MMMGIIKTVDIHCSQLNIVNFQLVNSVQFPIFKCSAESAESAVKSGASKIAAWSWSFLLRISCWTHSNICPTNQPVWWCATTRNCHLQVTDALHRRN